MKQINNNKTLNKSLTNANNKSFPFVRVFTEKGIVDIDDVVTASNGVTFSDFNFELGGNITVDTTLNIANGVDFSIVGANGNGLFQVDDGGNAIFLGSPSTTTGINIYPNVVNLTAPDELNIISNLLSIKDSDDNAYFVLKQIGSDVLVFAPNLPTYADEAAAVLGGLSTNVIYKTATGELRIKL